MSDTLHCPSCGHDSPGEATHCARCNFPLDDVRATETEAPTPPVRGFNPSARPMRVLRPRPARAQPVQVQLWLISGVVVVAILLFTGLRGFQQSNHPPVEGAQGQQQERADAAREMLARDSNHIEARIALADVLYDTANWPEAIVHYKAAARRDSTRVSTWVDMGVAYYNLADRDEARRLFQRGLQLDPHHPVALFNMGVLAESSDSLELALDYYHRATRSSPPETMREPLVTRLREVMTKLGRQAPPLEPGAGAQAPPAGGTTR